MKHLLLFISCIVWLSSCSGDEKGNKQDAPEARPLTTDSPTDTASGDTVGWDELSVAIMKDPNINLNMNISQLNYWQLRILRNLIPARQGYLFMESDLRAWFMGAEWYTEKMEARWYGECEDSGQPKQPPIAYSSEEAAFMERCKTQSEVLRKEQHTNAAGNKTINLDHVVNIWQFSQLEPKVREKLLENEFAMLEGENVQFFQLYEENDYSQTQNFITTDMALHLGHIHTSFLVRNIEEMVLYPMVTKMMKEIAVELKVQALKYPEQKDQLEYLQAFFSVGAALGGAPLETYCPPSYLQAARAEINNIKKEKDGFSDIMPAYKSVTFPFSMFKPRGHYTRSEELKLYFKMVQWMQWASFCLTDENEFTNALIASTLLQSPGIKSMYSKYMELTTLFFNEPDNLSALDLHEIAAANGVVHPGAVAGINHEDIRKKAIALSGRKNRIRPKIERGCADVMNFMPARYMFDNEIIQEMTWIERNSSTKRPYAKGLDVFAALGDKGAEDILINEYNEDKNWNKFLPNLRAMQKKFRNFSEWDRSVYNKTIEILHKNLWVDKRAPEFMHGKGWKRKNLNASLAAWAELKHDAVLYAEQPFGAECGGGEMCSPPPDPIVKGYVEPNTEVYLHLIESLTITLSHIEEMPEVRSKWSHTTKELIDYYQFLLDVSRKELEGRPLTEDDYRKIEIMGSTVEWMTVQMMGLYEWYAVKGADKEVALVADIYTNNEDKQKAGILHVATGNVNDLYVLVEIGGELYLTRGAAFSYYEFVQPLNKRLTDEEWQEMLKKKEAPSMPKWIEPIMVPGVLKPQVKEVVYSSGC